MGFSRCRFWVCFFYYIVSFVFVLEISFRFLEILDDLVFFFESWDNYYILDIMEFFFK